MRLSPTAYGLIAAAAKKLGVSKSAVLEMAIRSFAEQQKIVVGDEGATDEQDL
jgi:hypothetical protein